ncbi:uncharacterized protein EI90DRAFT_3125310 [Cantharellus anzutake]|uniref:uncharacterized protein n=1 Tax=Cantharellus anzutake TaxID=1750568 RepID=UPI001906AA27|nr:uncharacterized protein EI90DRAFT_3125310 [Cantharellus anzutake]KAF8329554.1 hypothetical protein EI90DRAFT_3125310 [Cantharellus anzutake]
MDRPDPNPDPLEPPFEFCSPIHSSSSSSSPAWLSSMSESSEDHDETIYWPESPPTLHPHSASTKSTRRPKLYEKRVTLKTPPGSPIFPLDATPRQAPKRGNVESSPQTPSQAFHSYGLRDTNSETEMWEAALSRAIDSSEGRVDLSNCGLTRIPHNISDLAKLVVIKKPHDASFQSRRPFSRVASAPARSVAPQKREFGRYATTTFQLSNTLPPNNASTPEIELYLGGNLIKALPRELFGLWNLTVLSLRSNSIEYLPPSIANLNALVELNLANNKLKYLPAELTHLPKLARLNLSPNPFLPPPGTITRDVSSLLNVKWLQPRHPPTVSKRVLGPLTRVYPHVPSRVLPLSELCLRVLLSPSRRLAPTGTAPLLVWQEYELDEWSIPVSIRRALLASIDTNSRYQSPPNADHDNLFNEMQTSDELLLLQAASYYPHCCPNPSHTRPFNSASISFTESLDLSSTFSLRSFVAPRKPIGSTANVYLRHAEERLEWVKTVAGVKISTNDMGPSVPILWRGCSMGCLSFLETSNVQTPHMPPLRKTSTFNAPFGGDFPGSEGGDGFDLDELDDWTNDTT